MPVSKENIVWIDLEMTGLNAFQSPPSLKPGDEFLPDRVIEVACIVTDKELEPLDGGIELVVKVEKEVLDRMNDWCIEQHGKTGLTKLCLESKTTITEIDSLVSSYVAQHFPPGFTSCLLAGNSVHVDKIFINKDLPKLAAMLHYRILDVSTIKELSRRWYPELPLPPKEMSSHRALSDIEDSIAELRYYREKLFKKGLDLMD